MTRQNCPPSFRQYCPALFSWLVALMGLLAAPGFLLSTSAQENLPTLEADKTIGRRMTGGETHAFRVALAAGQYLRVEADQRGIDVVLRVFDPNGEKLSEMDSLNLTQGLEVTSIIAQRAGNYRVEVVSTSKAVPPGQYEVKIAALRTATEQDRQWMAAQQAYAEGRQMRAQSAAEAQRQALMRFENALGHWRASGDQLMAAHALHYLAASYRRLGQPQQALVHYDQALQLVRSLGERREEATLLVSMGIVNNELGEPRKSLEYYDKPLSFWREIKDTYNEAKTLINIGRAYGLLGESRKALENYIPALAVWQKLGNREQAADTLNYFGLAYADLDELQKSLEHYDQALKLYRALGNRSGEAASLNNLGFIYGKLGESQKQFDYYQQALALWRLTGDRRQEANTLSNVGLAEAQRNNPQKALANYEQALRLWRAAGDRRGEAGTLQYLGDLHAASAETKRALAYYDQSMQLLRVVGDQWRAARVLVSIGSLNTASGAPQQAREYFSQALTICRTVGDRSGEASALYGLARAERELGNLAVAREQSEAALALIEAVRANVGSQQLRASYLASVQKYYQLNLDVLMRLHRNNPAAGYDALALQASERARARGLLEQLTEARADIRQGVDPALLERERQLTQQLNAIAQRQLGLTSGRGGDVQLTALKQEIGQLEDEYNQVQTTIRQRSPHYAALTQPQPLGLREIQAQLDADSLLLEYALGEERSFLWAVTKDSLKTYELHSREQIEQAARRVYTLVTARADSPPGELPAQRRARLARTATQLSIAARQLSQLTLGPVAAELGQRRLVIVADGALQQTPFALLPEPESGRAGERASGRKDNPQSAIRNPQSAMPLVVKHEIISLPSASTLAIQRRELANRQPAPKLIAVLADPVFDRSDERARLTPPPTAAPKQSAALARANARSIEHLAESGKQSVIGGRVRIPRLPFTRQEAEQILALAPGSANLKALGFQANRAVALGAELGQYRYLHFATHGYLDNERPGLSALVLSLLNEKGEAEDGFLRAHEIYNLNLPAELVVLSACQTGLGKEVKGEGLVGLTRGFMYAGAARVVVSLWNVNDKATAELMAKFYLKMLKEGQRPAAALRAAQVELWRQKQWEAPYYWAAFVLQGEWK